MTILYKKSGCAVTQPQIYCLPMKGFPGSNPSAVSSVEELLVLQTLFYHIDQSLTDWLMLINDHETEDLCF